MMISGSLSMALYRGMGQRGGNTILGPGGISPLVTYAQSGNLTYFDSTGTLQTAAVDTMVRDYAPSTLALRGYPFWRASTNLLLRSQEFDNAVWSTTNLSIVANSIASPDGTTNADTINGVATATNKILRPVSAPTISAGVVHTCSLFVKYKDAQFLSFTFDDGATANGVWTSFDLLNGTISQAATAYGTGASASSTITPIRNGWYRITLTGTAGTVSTTPRWATSIQLAGNTQFASYSTTTGYYAYGASLEAAPFVTPYIPTTTSAVTRAAPSCAITGANFTSFYNQAASTVICAGATSTLTTSNIQWGIGDPTLPFGSRNAIYSQSTAATGVWSVPLAVGGVSQITSAALTGSFVANTVAKTAMAYALNNTVGAKGGSAGTTDTSCTMPIVTGMSIGSGAQAWDGGLSFWNGWISELSYFPSRLPNATLQSLST